jgi:4-hydroxyphenylpyruvate dioxygenase
VEQSPHLPTVIPLLTADEEALYAPSSRSKLVGKAEGGAAASQSYLFTAIDHVVLNVPMGELQQAAQWYSTILDLDPGQHFTIQTEYSALHSLVLKRGAVQLPINEPASSTSQIQEFLDVNRGAGIQHIALQTPDILHTVQQLRSSCIPLISVPDAYYHHLQQHYPLEVNWTAIAAQEILVDWQDDTAQALLLQTFTQPIFPQPTFFFEVIERQAYWHQGRYQAVQGFGERNFRALVTAIEQEQLKRLSTQKATN